MVERVGAVISDSYHRLLTVEPLTFNERVSLLEIHIQLCLDEEVALVDDLS